VGGRKKNPEKKDQIVRYGKSATGEMGWVGEKPELSHRLVESKLEHLTRRSPQPLAQGVAVDAAVETLAPTKLQVKVGPARTRVLYQLVKVRRWKN
jgi:hypothetical protein